MAALSDDNTKPQIFSLFVTLKFTQLQDKEEFLVLVRPLADYIRREEPTTLAFDVICHDADPLQVMLVERYQEKATAFLQIHKSSPHFLNYRPKLQQMQNDGRVIVSGNSYLDSGIGFIGR